MFRLRFVQFQEVVVAAGHADGAVDRILAALLVQHCMVLDPNAEFASAIALLDARVPPLLHEGRELSRREQSCQTPRAGVPFRTPE